ncbi:ataxin-10 isoform X2 [Esox lucius]|uniref:Ataxin-10 n=1 Tax=Esox lucius TaxID=8010 RepID=A0A3P8XUX8_ESOLU|nr:ataxin-10 isoform X2 [Esox lucius]
MADHAQEFLNSMDFPKLLNEILAEQFSENHLPVLQSLTNALRIQDYRDHSEEETFQNLMKILSKLSEEIQAAGREVKEVILQLTTACFRAQRNGCVQCARNQSLLRSLGFIDLSIRILDMLLKLKAENSDYILEAIRCGIQFIGNLAVDNQFCKDDIWKLIFPDLLLALLCLEDHRAAGYASMVLHTCLDGLKVEQLAQPGNIHVALKVMDLCRTQPELDWPVLIATQHFLKSSVLVVNMYSGMSYRERVTLLELISAQLGEGNSEDCGISPSVASFLASCFQECCGAVLTLASGSDDEEALTVISLLDVLCEMTSDHKQFMFLQNHPELLNSTVGLLQQVHALGKTSKNVFTAAQNFSLAQGGDGSSSPAVSFKAHLIRLIGNLCHGNAANQNKVRELDCLPLIMDNCSIDSNNPFISQWAIFAIRNILEHNLENQKLVAALERQGVADDSALRALGFRLEERDGNLLLKPCSKDP